VVIVPGTVKAVAEATGEVAKTANTGLQLLSRFVVIFDEPLKAAGNLLGNEIKYITSVRAISLYERWCAKMEASGLHTPTREIPLKFAFPLLTAAITEEDDDLQEVWANLLVNAGDAATEMELRTAYVEMLRGMSGFDVLNLSKLAEEQLSAPAGRLGFYVVTANLPHSARGIDSGATDEPPKEVAISVANLARLGCVAPTSGFGGGINFGLILVTELGLAFYRACSAPAKHND
jgi:Abortive infection alpha